MPLLGPSIDYTDKDFDALNARMRNLIRRAFPQWTNEQVANFGNLQVELFAHVGDVVTKYQDNQAGEAFLMGVTQRKNVLAHAKRFGYAPRGRTASMVDLTLEITSGAPAAAVAVPARTKAKTESVVSPVSFETLAAAQFDAGTVGPIVVTAENAQQRSELFAANGRPGQELVLGATPFLDGSLELTASNGLFEVVDNFLDSTSTDLHVTIGVDQNDRARVRFGDGRNGALPSGTITAVYKTGGGIEGKVEPGAVRRLEGAFFDAFGNPVTVVVTNAAASTDALARQSLDQIKMAIPESLRVLERTVAREDYEINAKRVPGVVRALMLTSDQYTPIDENRGILYVVGPGGADVPVDVRAAVLEMVTTTYPKTITFQVEVRTAVWLDVNIAATVHLAQGANRTTTRAAILDRLARAFAVEPTSADVQAGLPLGVDFGWNLRDSSGELAGVLDWSTIFNIIRDTPGVKKIPADAGLLLNGVEDDLAINIVQFPRLGTVTLTDGDSGTTL